MSSSPYCSTCGECIGHLGRFYTWLRIPLLKHTCMGESDGPQELAANPAADKEPCEDCARLKAENTLLSKSLKDAIRMFDACAESMRVSQHVLQGNMPEGLPIVEGDLLPGVGSKVFIHLNSCDAWVEHTVTGYYVWASHGGDESLHRVFVRVKDKDGMPNARMLCDVRTTKPTAETPV